MNWREDFAEDDQKLGEAIAHFKASMDAWSDAALSQPRTMAPAVTRRSWRWAASWAMGAVLAAGLVAGGVRQIVDRQQMATIAARKPTQPRATGRSMAAREAALPANGRARKQEAANAATQAKTDAHDDALLASVDRDLAREVPSAMEPLAQLMNVSAPTNDSAQ